MGLLSSIIGAIVNEGSKNLTGADKINEMRRNGDSISKMSKYVAENQSEFPDLNKKKR